MKALLIELQIISVHVHDFSELSSVNSQTEQYNYRSKAAGIEHSRNTCKDFIHVSKAYAWIDHNHNRNNCEVNDTVYKSIRGIVILHLATNYTKKLEL